MKTTAIRFSILCLIASLLLNVKITLILNSILNFECFLLLFLCCVFYPTLKNLLTTALNFTSKLLICFGCITECLFIFLFYDFISQETEKQIHGHKIKIIKKKTVLRYTKNSIEYVNMNETYIFLSTLNCLDKVKVIK